MKSLRCIFHALKQIDKHTSTRKALFSDVLLYNPWSSSWQVVSYQTYIWSRFFYIYLTCDKMLTLPIDPRGLIAISKGSSLINILWS